MKYEKKAECSTFVARFIKIANLIPAGIDPPNPFDIVIRGFGRQGEDDVELNRESRLRRFRESLAPFPEFVEYLQGAKDEDEKPFMESYDFFISVREILTTIVELSEEYRSFLSDGKIMWYHVPVKIPFQMRVNWKHAGQGINDGKIRFEDDSIARTFEGCELMRFRRCRSCQNIFWAKKTNAQTCKQTCAKDLYNEKRLAKNKEEISKEREQARRQFLNQDFSKKNNGNL